MSSRNTESGTDTPKPEAAATPQPTGSTEQVDNLGPMRGCLTMTALIGGSIVAGMIALYAFRALFG